MARVQALGCVACDRMGLPRTPAEIHHLLHAGERIDHFHVLPLCALHHRGGVNEGLWVSRHPWHAEFERAYGTEQELLTEVRRRLGA